MMYQKVQIAREMLQHNLNTMRRAGLEYREGRCGKETLRTIMDVTDLSIRATQELVNEYVSTIGRREI